MRPSKIFASFAALLLLGQPAIAAGPSGGGPAGAAVSVSSATPNVLINPSPGTGKFTIGLIDIFNAQTNATSYTVQSSDMGKIVTHTSSAAVAVSLPQAGTTGFLTGVGYSECNYGTGTVTITAGGTSLIKGSSGTTTLILAQNQCADLVSDGTNWNGSIATNNSFSAPVSSPALIATGTKFTTSGCAVSATVGGASAGTYTSGTAGTCTVVVTFGITAPDGWSCFASDRTTAADLITQTASTTTTATLSGTTASGDVVSFGCMGN